MVIWTTLQCNRIRAPVGGNAPRSARRGSDTAHRVTVNPDWALQGSCSDPRRGLTSTP
jgi:hypothetical protein